MMINLVEIKAWYSKHILQLVFEKITGNNSQIKSLDGLRAIAVLLVFLEHISGHGVILASLFDFTKTGMGRSGVYLFFVLSSFLLTSQFLRPNIDLNNSKMWLNYALRRVLRIYPLYIFVLLVYLVFPSFKYDITDVLNHLTLQEGLNHFWTIVVEIKYYLILPVFVWFFVIILRRKLPLAILNGTAFIVVIEIVKATILPQSRLSPFPHLSIFLMGSLAALAHAEILKLSQTTRKRIGYAMEIVAIIAFLIILSSYRTVWSRTAWGWIFGSEMPLFPSSHWLYVLHGCLWSVFLVSHLHGKGFVSKILSYPPLRFIGIVSFGMYLWHIAVLGYLNAHLPAPSFVKFLAISAVTLGVSTVTYVAIERPFMRLRFRLLETRA